jgi:ribose transport system substrate-binding protein
LAWGILEIGNEAVVNTGYTWVDKENMEDEAVQLMLYE